LTLITSGKSRVNLIIPDAAISYCVAGLNKDLNRPILIIAVNPERARKIYDDLLFWSKSDNGIHLFPEVESVHYERLTPDESTIHERIIAIDAITDQTEARQIPIIITSIHAMAQATIAKEVFRKARHQLYVGQTVQMNTLVQYWISIGYRVEGITQTPGTISRRGGILDIFSPGYDGPIRVELFGDKIESIRFFDPSTQISIGSTDNITILPVQESLTSLIDKNNIRDFYKNLDFSNCNQFVKSRIEEEIEALINGDSLEYTMLYHGFTCDSSLLDFLPDNSLVVLEKVLELEDQSYRIDYKNSYIRKSKEDRGEIPGNFPSIHLYWEKLKGRIHDSFVTLETNPWIQDMSTGGDVLEIGFLPLPHYMGNLKEFTEDITSIQYRDNPLILVSNHAKRLSDLLDKQSIVSSVEEEPVYLAQQSSISVLRGSLEEGWSLPLREGRLNVLTDFEIFGQAKKRLFPKKTNRRRLPAVSEIAIGSLLVHIEHGIARFIGTTHMEVGDNRGEFLILEYAEQDKLYVPTEQMDRISPYVSPSDKEPKLSRLGTQEWNRAKNKAKLATEELAKELLDLYAAREASGGIAYSQDTPWQSQLEDAFQYEETVDQLHSILDVKRDMEANKPMDRLICGDVGYGKTEVALRAAFKAVMDGFQVAILVPTTLLAQQHYSTFAERLAAFPINIDVLSRFRSDQDQKLLIEGIKDGSVDICIGTHRLLQKDVNFKNLGFVVVDEEQRFGVGQKEKLKSMRNDVDVLALSATPIPRTLHMSLAGIRDMSTIDTPPEERLSIKTYLCEYSEIVIREAIVRELDRGGQVFFLHNRVRTIEETAEKIRELVPEASVAVGHGRMVEDELDKVMTDFSNRRFDVLVCTTIIESGLDMPNVNTLLIERADTMGLAQLYQLRGRIGRGVNRAYAYIMVPNNKRITEVAQKRLKTIAGATELGSGFRIAMRDLEIRGAGSLLGREQSGHIGAVGYELYSYLLSKSVEDLRNNVQDVENRHSTRFVDVHVDLPLDSYIPLEYIPDLPSRLSIYQRMASTKDVDEIYMLGLELEDRFGAIPQALDNLFYILRLKSRAIDASIGSFTRDGARIVIKLLDEVGGARLALQRYIGDLGIVGNTQIRMNIGLNWMEMLTQLTERIISFKTEIIAGYNGHEK
jgi:transcription-repair coupling factor (superfamily II helicase)